MKPMSVKEIAEAIEGSRILGNDQIVIENVSTDSRVIPEKGLFVPIKGANADGHSFLMKAAENGASALVSERMEAVEGTLAAYPDIPVILVKDTTEALQDLAKAARLKTGIPAVGVTGSVGKTTTREMISTALSAGLKVYKTENNFNNWLGLPMTLLSMTDEDDIAVLELGMNVRGELGRISSLSDLDAAVITNIGVAHMEYYGSQEEILKEKLTITRGFTEGAPEDKMVFLNADDPFLKQAAATLSYPVTLYGTSDEADYQVKNVRSEDGFTVFDLYRYHEFLLPVRLSVLGSFNVLNAAAAMAVADRYHVDLEKAADKLASFTGFKNRLQRFMKDGCMIIDDTYNASPASMKAGLDVLEGLTDRKGKKIAVLGDMFELGDETPAFHYEVGVYAASKKIDVLYVIGEQSEEIKKGAMENGAPFEIRHFDDKQTLISVLKEMLLSGDTVYLKASNGMKLKEVTEGLLA